MAKLRKRHRLDRTICQRGVRGIHRHHGSPWLSEAIQDRIERDAVFYGVSYGMIHEWILASFYNIEAENYRTAYARRQKDQERRAHNNRKRKAA